MALHRLFVALRPPSAIRDHLLSLAGGIAGARWQSDEQLHCTLRFIGEVDRHQAEDIAAALGGISHPPLALRLGEAGTFDKNGRIDTLWISIQPRPDVKALHDKIDRALRVVGIAPDGRAYLPHITLARFARSAGASPAIVRTVRSDELRVFTATDFRLYESRLGSEGASYETVARYPLS